MAQATAPTLEIELRALDAWWREAGVEHAFLDAPQNWLAEPEDEELDEPEPIAALEVERSVELLAGGPANWPSTLEAFDRWWLSEPALRLGTGKRVPPRGPAKAKLMALVPQPEAEDGEVMLSGPQGALLANMLAAFGIAPEECRVAALIPSHLPHPDWPALDRAGWGALARHHLALAAPERLLVFGGFVPPLLGHDPAQDSATMTQVALEGGSVPAICARGLDTLLLRPRLQARVWQRWLEWTD